MQKFMPSLAIATVIATSSVAHAQQTSVDPPPIERVTDLARARFSQTQGWFRLVADARFTVDELGGLTPQYDSLTHPRVRRSDNAGYSVIARFAAQFTDAMRVSIVGQPGYELRVSPINAQRARAVIEDGLVVYRDGWLATDVLYKSTPTHIDEYLLLRNSQAPTTWRYRVELGAQLARLRQTAGAIEAMDARGAARLRANRPTAIDATGRRFDGEIRVDGLTLIVQIDLRGASFPVLVDPDWRPTADMAFGRFYNGAHVLPDGRVLVTGGCSASVCSGDLTIPACRTLVNSAETLDTGPRTWSRAGDDPVARFFHGSVSLRDGSVLVAGGCTESTCGTTTNNVQLYSGGAFRALDPLSEARAGIGAVLLRDGRVLLAGGCSSAGCTTRSELFDPGTMAIRATGSLGVARGRSTVTTLRDGRVLVVGGCTNIVCSGVHTSAEVFDPRTERWTTVAPMSRARAGHWSALLDDGRVIVGGGCSEQACATILDDTEVLDVTLARWSAGPTMSARRVGAEAVRLPNGTVMVSQGCQSRTGCDLSNEVLDRGATRFDPIESALTIRAFHRTIIHEPTQQVIALGGCQPRTCSWWNETYDISAIRPIEDAGADVIELDATDAATEDVAFDARLEERDSSVPAMDAAREASVGSEPAVQRPACGCRVVGARSNESSRTVVLLCAAAAIAVITARRRRPS
ncbi:MAG: kelch repeat-containing protein [Polyangiales bacterium]